MGNTNENVKVNKKYKDTLFREIFGKKENLKFLLELYNALNGTGYTDEAELELTTLDDVVYIRMKNDVSFVLRSEMNLFEHQSTYNPNMPIRGLLYFAYLYEAYLQEQKTDIYGTTLMKLPTPRYIVFYNGDRETEDVMKLRLSDAFEISDDSGEFEWTATLININQGHNKELMEKSRALREYASFVAMVKKNSRMSGSLREAVDKAVEVAVANNYLGGYFKKHREGVVSMLLAEFDEVKYAESRREEGRREGLKEGRQKGLKEGRQESLTEVIKNLRSAGLSMELISEYLKIPLEDIRKYTAP